MIRNRAGKPAPSLSTTNAQQPRFARAVEVLHRGIRQRAFPGAAFAVTHNGIVLACGGVGNFTYQKTSAEVTSETIYDLASLTKAIATTTAAMILYERGKLPLASCITDLVPEFAHGDPRKSSVTLQMLLSHCSGLPAHAKLYEMASAPADALQAAFALPLRAEPGTRTDYSDIGFIVLGEVVNRLAGERLDSFCTREIFHPLGMSRTSFAPGPDQKPLIPPTVKDDLFRHRTIQGEVNDENAAILGGVAGQAGLFAPASDVAAFAECMLRGGAPILKPATIALFTKRRSLPLGTSWALGWDTPSSPSQSGKFFSSESFGHLGYTGTSLWIDPQRRLSVTLLTNRTWPRASSQKIKRLRPAFHDAIVEALGDK